MWRTGLLEKIQQCCILRNQKIILSLLKEWVRTGWSLRLHLASKFCDILLWHICSLRAWFNLKKSENRGKEENYSPIMHFAGRKHIVLNYFMTTNLNMLGKTIILSSCVCFLVKKKKSLFHIFFPIQNCRLPSPSLSTHLHHHSLPSYPM